MSETETANAQADARLYELGVNLVPTLEDKIEAAFENIKSIITSNGGAITADSKPALIDLAYTMGKNIDSKWYRYNTAYFGWVKFTAEPSKLAELKEEFDVDGSILRYMILNTTAEAATSAQDLADAIKGDKESDPVAAEEVETEAVAEVDAEVEKDADTADVLAIDDKIDEAIDELVVEA
jgi:ribosomal protein S6